MVVAVPVPLVRAAVIVVVVNVIAIDGAVVVVVMVIVAATRARDQKHSEGAQRAKRCHNSHKVSPVASP
jgi:hypothetical protein